MEYYLSSGYEHGSDYIGSVCVVSPYTPRHGRAHQVFVDVHIQYNKYYLSSGYEHGSDYIGSMCVVSPYTPRHGRAHQVFVDVQFHHWLYRRL